MSYSTNLNRILIKRRGGWFFPKGIWYLSMYWSSQSVKKINTHSLYKLFYTSLILWYYSLKLLKLSESKMLLEVTKSLVHSSTINFWHEANTKILLFINKFQNFHSNLFFLLRHTLSCLCLYGVRLILFFAAKLIHVYKPVHMNMCKCAKIKCITELRGCCGMVEFELYERHQWI